MAMQQKWVHIIGMCGITTSGIAVMFKELGWHVTGSDKGFFPPVSDFLKQNNIALAPGYKMERLHENDKIPDLVVIQGTKGDKNEEYQEAMRLNIPIKAYAEVLNEYVASEESIVVAGSFGKTTTTSILVNVFKQAGIPISYMYGGLTPDFAMNVAALKSDTKFSIIEGDEYLTSFNDKRSKFFHYHPKYLVLTGLEYDHVDLFPTPKSYFDNFKKLLAEMPENGIIFANIDDQNIQKVITSAKCKIVTFSGAQNLNLKPDWYLLRASRPLPTIIKNPTALSSKLEIIPFARNILGKFNDLNMLAAAVVASELNVSAGKIQAGLESYAGIQRRLQIKLRKGDSLIIDDFGSTPAKASACLATIKEEFPKHHLIAVFEPNSGNRDAKALTLFSKTFVNADLLVLPKFTMLPKSSEARFSENDLWELVNENGIKAEYFPIDKDVITALKHEFTSHKKTIVVFLGSHSFRGMINEFIKSVS